MTDDPLIVEFQVGVPPAEAFDVWTRRCAVWRPRSHTVSGDPSAITFEARAGGRIVERGRDGAEHDWGRVLDWEPPAADEAGVARSDRRLRARVLAWLRTARASFNGDQAGGLVLPVLTIVTVPVLSGWRLPGA